MDYRHFVRLKQGLIAAALVCLLLLMGLPARANEPVTLIAAGSYRWLPHFHLDHETGKISGGMYDILKEACRRSNTQVVFTALPWLRVLDNARHGEIDVVCGLFKTDERSKYLTFSPPLRNEEIRVFATGDLNINSYDDLIGLRGTAVRGTSYGKQFDDFAARTPHLHLTRVTDSSSFFKRLLSGATDYVICPNDDCKSELKRLGLQFKIIPLPFVIGHSDIHIAFSKKSKHADAIKRLMKAIEEMKADGTIDAIYRWYMPE